MTNFIAVFPLEVVVFPGEALNLHVFEPRYKQLMTECKQRGKPFGIPAVMDGELMEYGTLMELERIETVHDNGEMDVRTRGVRVFRLLELIREVPDKLYSGAIVNYPSNHYQGNQRLMGALLNSIRELHAILNLSKEFGKPDTELLSYDIAHHVGLKRAEEYEVLCLLHELQRQEYLKRHLQKAIPMAAELNGLRQRIQQNGHFRHLSLDNF